MPADAGVNPFVFIVGSPRSGTTLLQRMVDAHPSIAIPPETHWIPRLYRRRVGLTEDDHVTPELVERLVAHKRFPDMGIARAEVDRLLEDDELTYSQFVGGVYDIYARHQGKPLVGDKTPAYVYRIELLHDLFGQARFVHLIRDGRDVCLSALGWERKQVSFAGRWAIWSEDRVMALALWWKWHVRHGLEAKERHPELVHEVRYEALVADAEGECARLCAFLGLPYDEAMVRFHEGRVSDAPGLDAKHAWRPVTAGLRDWRSQMAPEDVERFEAVAGDTLAALGYEPATSPTEDTMRRARAALESFVREDEVASALPARW